MQKLILNDKTEIEVQEGVSLSNIQTIKNNMLEVDELKTKLTTEGNLDKIQFKQNDEVIGEYENMILSSPMFMIDEIKSTPENEIEEKLVVTFKLREKTEIEKIEERLNSLENCQLIQDGAIADLGSIIGEMSL